MEEERGDKRAFDGQVAYGEVEHGLIPVEAVTIIFEASGRVFPILSCLTLAALAQDPDHGKHA